MTIADCAAGREKTANLEGINDPAFIILFVGMLVLEAITIRLCDMNCYPIPPMGTTLVKTQQVVHVPPSTHLWTGRKKPKAKMARAMVRWMYVLTVGFCRLLPRRVMALSIWGKAKSSFSLVKGVIVAREDAPEEWPHPLALFAISLSQLSCLGVRAGGLPALGWDETTCALAWARRECLLWEAWEEAKAIYWALLSWRREGKQMEHTKTRLLFHDGGF